MNRLTTLSIFILILSGIFAQEAPMDSSAWFLERYYGKYFKADHYAPNIRVNGGVSVNHTEYNIDRNRTSKYIPTNETVLGADIPIYQKVWKNDALSFSMPLSFSVWFDFTEIQTAPILNTDYRFAPVEINYLHKFKHKTFRNIEVKFIPYFHESTHIGDELTIARTIMDARIVRVNVSYECMNLAVTLNDPLGKDQKNHAFRVGARILLNPSKGWYSISEHEGDTSLVPQTKKWGEVYLQYEYQTPDGFLSFGKTMFDFSAELNMRLKFGYPYHEKKIDCYPLVETTEKHVPSLNILAGWHFYNSNHELSNVGFYLRAYRGINYHGQFRNLSNYEFYGVSIIYDR